MAALAATPVPGCGNETRVAVAAGLVSAGYVDLTLAIMQQFGFAATEQLASSGDGSRVYTVVSAASEPAATSLRTVPIEGDASTAAFPLAMAAVTGGTVSVNVGSGSRQGDARFATLLARMGARVVLADDGESTVLRGPPSVPLTRAQTATAAAACADAVAPALGWVCIDGTAGPLPATHLRGLGEVDMAAMTDSFLVFAVVAAFAVGHTDIVNIANQRVKECDRIAAVVDGLRRLGLPAAPLPTGVRVYGLRYADEPIPSSLILPAVAPAAAAAAEVSPASEPLAPLPPATTTLTAHTDALAPARPGAAVVIACHSDHRVAMSFAVAGLRLPRTVIADRRCVGKTYPKFWAHLEARTHTSDDPAFGESASTDDDDGELSAASLPAGLAVRIVWDTSDLVAPLPPLSARFPLPAAASIGAVTPLEARLVKFPVADSVAAPGQGAAPAVDPQDKAAVRAARMAARAAAAAERAAARAAREAAEAELSDDIPPVDIDASSGAAVPAVAPAIVQLPVELVQYPRHMTSEALIAYKQHIMRQNRRVTAGSSPVVTFAPAAAAAPAVTLAPFAAPAPTVSAIPAAVSAIPAITSAAAAAPAVTTPPVAAAASAVATAAYTVPVLPPAAAAAVAAAFAHRETVFPVPVDREGLLRDWRTRRAAAAGSDAADGVITAPAPEPVAEPPMYSGPPASALLIGMRGAGKTTLGRVAAAATQRVFVDFDDEITAHTLALCAAAADGDADADAGVDARAAAAVLADVAARLGAAVANPKTDGGAGRLTAETAIKVITAQLGWAVFRAIEVSVLLGFLARTCPAVTALPAAAADAGAVELVFASVVAAEVPPGPLPLAAFASVFAAAPYDPFCAPSLPTVGALVSPPLAQRLAAARAVLRAHAPYVVACGGGVLTTGLARAALAAASFLPPVETPVAAPACTAGAPVRVPLFALAGSVCVVHVQRSEADIHAALTHRDTGAPAPTPLTALEAAAALAASPYVQQLRARLPLYCAAATHTFTISDGDSQWQHSGSEFAHFLAAVVAPASALRALLSGCGGGSDDGSEAAPLVEAAPVLREHTNFLCLPLPTLLDLAPSSHTGGCARFSAAAAALAVMSAESDAVELRADMWPVTATLSDPPSADDLLRFDAHLHAELAIVRRAAAADADAVAAAAAQHPALAADGLRYRPLPPALPVVFTLRSRAEGGRFAGSPALFSALCDLALRAGVRWVDVELSLPLPARRLVAAAAARRGAQLIASAHTLTASAAAAVHGGVAGAVAATAEMVPLFTAPASLRSARAASVGAAVRPLVDFIKLVGTATAAQAAEIAAPSVAAAREASALPAAPLAVVFAAAAGRTCVSAATRPNAGVCAEPAVAAAHAAAVLTVTSTGAVVPVSGVATPLAPVADALNLALRHAAARAPAAAATAGDGSAGDDIVCLPHPTPGLLMFDMGLYGKVWKYFYVTGF
jgi:5-enolpyruvylshikimate-3-phosphate synthase